MWRPHNPDQNNFNELKLVLHCIPMMIFSPHESLNLRKIKEKISHTCNLVGLNQSKFTFHELRWDKLTVPTVSDPSCFVCILYPFLLSPYRLNPASLFSYKQVHSLYLLTAHGSFNHSTILTWTHLSTIFLNSTFLSVSNIWNLCRFHSPVCWVCRIWATSLDWSAHITAKPSLTLGEDLGNAHHFLKLSYSAHP